MEKTELKLVQNVMHKHVHKTQSKIDKVHHGDNQFFIGREREQKWFLDALKKNSSPIIDLHGIAGIGKSFLLQRFRRIAKRENAFFILLNGASIKSTPDHFMKNILKYIGVSIEEKEQLLTQCVEILNGLAIKHKIVLVFDAYEQLGSIDEWIRQEFICQLDERIMIIFSGRQTLPSSWYTSPGWRKIIYPLPLREFDYLQTKDYLSKHHIYQKEKIKKMWLRTEGHPLYLSIVTHADQQYYNEQTEAFHFSQLITRWLEEIKDVNIRRLIEPIALIRQFDIDILTYITDTKISNSLFQRLTQASFIQMEKRGWSMHYVLRDAVSSLLQKSSPEKYLQYNNRIAQYYYEKVIHHTNIAQDPCSFNRLLDHIMSKNSKITYFSYLPDDTICCEEVEQSRLTQVFEKVKSRGSKQFDKYLDHHKSFIDLRYDKILAIKNKQDKILGIAHLTAIQDDSLAHLKEQTNLNLFKEYSFKEKFLTTKYSINSDVSLGSPKGWFIQLMYVHFSYDYKTKAALIYYLLPYLLQGRFCMVSTSHTVEQQILEQLGFEEYATELYEHIDQDATASKIYILSYAALGISNYLSEMAQRMGFTLESDIFHNLSKREREVAQLVITGYSNQDISDKLSVSLVTVKKHVGQILQKNDVSNRMQLLQKNISSHMNSGNILSTVTHVNNNMNSTILN